MKGIKRIICAVDFSQHSEVVAEYAVTLAKAFDAELIVVYAAPALTQYVGLHVPSSSIENFVGEIISGAEQSMKEFVEAHFQDVKAEGKVLNGYAAEEILDEVDRSDADMIVMGTHGRKGMNRLLFGSVAEKVVKSACIPVVTIRLRECE